MAVGKAAELPISSPSTPAARRRADDGQMSLAAHSEAPAAGGCRGLADRWGRRRPGCAAHSR